MHHVVVSPGLQDRVKYTKSSRRGHPQRYWYELNSEYALQTFCHLDQAANTQTRRDVIGLKQYLTKHPDCWKHLEQAPTRTPAVLKGHARQLSRA